MFSTCRSPVIGVTCSVQYEKTGKSMPQMCDCIKNCRWVVIDPWTNIDEFIDIDGLTYRTKKIWIFNQIWTHDLAMQIFQISQINCKNKTLVTWGNFLILQVMDEYEEQSEVAERLKIRVSIYIFKKSKLFEEKSSWIY